MDYTQKYMSRLISADTAARLVKSGDWVDFGWCTCTPELLDEAVAKRYEELYDVQFRGGVLLKKPAIFSVPNAAEHFTWNSWHMSVVERAAIKDGIAFYNPLRYSELPRYYHENIPGADVAMFQVAPMDDHGFFNFGPNASHMMTMCKNSKKIVVEVNENMPRCLGGYDEGIHIDEIDYIVEGEHGPLAEMPLAPPTEIDKKVASYIVDMIPNGACLQLGIGGMPNAVGMMIAESDLRDLGVHTEMYVDSFVDIAHAGKISCAKKNLDRGRQVFAFGAGTKKTYDYLNDNPRTMSAPVDYTNDVRIIAQLDNFVSINNAVDIDLFGQVNAESAGFRHISGAGGQLDFVMGAYLSNGGKSIICMSSTFKDKSGKKQSRIRPTLAPGSIVTDTRANVGYIVTEYGVANLKGLATWQRAEALINIAHPDFRDELVAEAEKMRIWRRSNRR